MLHSRPRCAPIDTGLAWAHEATCGALSGRKTRTVRSGQRDRGCGPRAGGVSRPATSLCDRSGASRRGRVACRTSEHAGLGPPGPRGQRVTHPYLIELRALEEHVVRLAESLPLSPRGTRQRSGQVAARAPALDGSPAAATTRDSAGAAGPGMPTRAEARRGGDDGRRARGECKRDGRPMTRSRPRLAPSPEPRPGPPHKTVSIPSSPNAGAQAACRSDSRPAPALRDRQHAGRAGSTRRGRLGAASEAAAPAARGTTMSVSLAAAARNRLQANRPLGPALGLGVENGCSMPTEAASRPAD